MIISKKRYNELILTLGGENVHLKETIKQRNETILTLKKELDNLLKLDSDHLIEYTVKHYQCKINEPTVKPNVLSHEVDVTEV